MDRKRNRNGTEAERKWNRNGLAAENKRNNPDFANKILQYAEKFANVKNFL
jgi:hypothetical protein